MVPFLEWGAIALSLGAGWWLYRSLRFRKRRAQFQDCLDQCAREHGIVFEPRSLTSHSARGRLEDFDIRVSWATSEATVGDQKYADVEGYFMFLKIVIEGPRIPAGVRFGADSGLGEDLLTGDSVFDDVVEVYGPASVVRALFNRELRQKVAVFVRSDGRLANGQLVLRTRLATEWDTPARLRMAVALMRELSSSERGGICERLAENARADPMPGVRLWNLLQLQEEFAETPQAQQLSREGLSDKSPWVRLSAARFLPDEGAEVLEALARAKDAPDTAAAEAIGLLAARLPGERSGSLLIELLKSRTGDARRQAIEELGRLRHAPAFGPLVVMLDRGDPRTAASAADALGRLGDPKAEASLLQAVTSDVHELRLAAATALGRVGTIRSIEPLTELIQKRQLDTESRQALTQTIGRIQSRLAGAGAGQLSLADASHESGRLSLAEPSAGPGDLSLAAEPPTKPLNRRAG